MAIKILKNNKEVGYKSSKKVLTTADILEADKFDLRLKQLLKEIEGLLLKGGLLTKQNKKRDSLKAWYIIGGHINKFIKQNEIPIDDTNLFWRYLYGRSTLINRSVPKNKISEVRNDFKTASRLANLKFETLEKVGPWAMWREILAYNVILNDKRVLNWVIDELSEHRKTRDKARPFLKNIATRFKRVDTNILTDKELRDKLKPFRQ